MKKESKWGIRIVCVLTGLLMAVGCYAIAAEYGSQSDPLVTLSYINEVLLPQTKSELDEKLAQTVSSYDQTLQQKTQELEQYVDRQVRNYSSGQLDSAVIDQIAAAASIFSKRFIANASAADTCSGVPQRSILPL